MAYRNDSEIVVGAGTVVDADTAHFAIIAGAEYIVSSSFDKEASEICNLYQNPENPVKFYNLCLL